MSIIVSMYTCMLCYCSIQGEIMWILFLHIEKRYSIVWKRHKLFEIPTKAVLYVLELMHIFDKVNDTPWFGTQLFKKGFKELALYLQ